MIDKWNTKVECKRTETENKERREKEKNVFIQILNAYDFPMLWLLVRWIFVVDEIASVTCVYIFSWIANNEKNIYKIWLFLVNDCVHFSFSSSPLLVCRRGELHMSHSLSFIQNESNTWPYRQWSNLIRQPYALCAYFMLSFYSSPEKQNSS